MYGNARSANNGISRENLLIFVFYFTVVLVAQAQVFSIVNVKELNLPDSVNWSSFNNYENYPFLIGKKEQKLFVFDVFNGKIKSQVLIPREFENSRISNGILFCKKNNETKEDKDSLLILSPLINAVKKFLIPSGKIILIFDLLKKKNNKYWISYLERGYFSVMNLNENKKIISFKVNPKTGRIAKAIILLSDYIFAVFDYGFPIYKIDYSGKILQKFGYSKFRNHPYTKEEINTFPLQRRIFLKPNIDLPPVFSKMLIFRKKFLALITKRRPLDDKFSIMLFNMNGKLLEVKNVFLKQSIKILDITIFSENLVFLVKNKSCKLLLKKIRFNN